MALIDWIIAAGFCVFVLLLGTLFTKKASGSMKDYFVSGRQLPWWLAGTSILATSFAADTPLHVTRIIREDGLSGAWFYWNGILGGLLIAFFFARLWQRSDVITDAQFIELRYSGKPATVLRGVMAVFKAFVLEILTLGWVILGMVKITKTIMNLPDYVSIAGFEVSTSVLMVAVLVGITLAYTTAGGLWGVVMTDFFEFVIAMVGGILLTIIVMHKVGGVDGLRQGIEAARGSQDALNFAPHQGAAGITFTTLAIYMGVMWWTNPEVDGSGQKAQRFLSCKSEGHALASGLWTMAVQYVLRNWIWYVSALASIILYPAVTDHEIVYPLMISELLPAGLKGVMVASFFAAFMSTVCTHLNLTASYLTNDLYKRFLKRSATEEHYVKLSRFATLLVCLLASIAALNMTSVLGALKLKTELAAGIGLVCVARWYWWRVNAWSEISALAASVATCIIVNLIPSLSGGDRFPIRLVIIVAATTAVWISVTLLTSPEPESKLSEFYKRVRPAAVFWGPIARRVGRLKGGDSMSDILLNAVLGVISIFSAMFCLGKFLLGAPVQGALFLLATVASAAWLGSRILKKPAIGKAAQEEGGPK